MFAALFRILVGLVFASFVAAAVQVLFALPPTELATANDDGLASAGEWILLTATIFAMFAAPFVLVGGLISEIGGIRSFAYHAIVGILIALGGCALLYSGQAATDPSIANSYAIAAFLTSGFVGGLAYWLIAGRFAGGRRRASIAETGGGKSTAAPGASTTGSDPKAAAKSEAKAPAKPTSDAKNSTPGPDVEARTA